MQHFQEDAMRNRVKNVNSKDFARLSKSTAGRGKSAPNAAKDLAGVTMDSGYGTCATNTTVGTGISTRGSREAFGAPKGPGGRY